MVAKSEGDYASAKALYEESLAIKCELGDRWGMSATLNSRRRAREPRHACSVGLGHGGGRLDHAMGAYSSVSPCFTGVTDRTPTHDATPVELATFEFEGPIDLRRAGAFVGQLGRVMQ